MARPRAHMTTILAHLDVLCGRKVTSAQIATSLDLSLDQVRSALKILRRNDELNSEKDGDTARGYLYRTKKPPAYVFVDPRLFDAKSVIGSMALKLMQSQATANDFSILDMRGTMTVNSVLEDRRA